MPPRSPHRNQVVTGWRRRESNPGPQGVQSTFVHVRSRWFLSGKVRGFGHDLAIVSFGHAADGTFTRPSPSGLHPDATSAILRQDGSWFLRPRARLRYRSQLLYGPLSRWGGRHRTQIDLQSPRRNRSPPWVGAPRVVPSRNEHRQPKVSPFGWRASPLRTAEN